MKLSVVYHFKQEFINPRCRLHRYRDMVCVYDVTVEEPDEFPKAFVVECYGNYYNEKVKETEFRIGKETIRTYKGKLYKPYREVGGNEWGRPMEGHDVIDYIGGRFRYETFRSEGDAFIEGARIIGDTHAEAEEEMNRTAKKFLFFDDMFWIECEEPMYVIMTFGLGHNHASTSLMIETRGYNINIPKERYFPATKREEAVRYAAELAIARGDTDSVDRILNSPEKIHVITPELVKRQPLTEHGDGDAFIKELETLIENSEDVDASEKMVLLHTATRLLKAGV